MCAVFVCVLIGQCVNMSGFAGGISHISLQGVSVCVYVRSVQIFATHLHVMYSVNLVEVHLKYYFTAWEIEHFISFLFGVLTA